MRWNWGEVLGATSDGDAFILFSNQCFMGITTQGGRVLTSPDFFNFLLRSFAERLCPSKVPDCFPRFVAGPFTCSSHWALYSTLGLAP